MKAAVIRSYGSADQLCITEMERPAPATGEALVRVHAAAVNPKDTFIRKGRFRPFSGSRMPLQTGFDFAGVVEAVGPEVKGVQVGAAVYGMQREIFRGRSCAEYLAVAPDQFAAKPANLDFCQAAALPLVSLTALQALRDDGRLRAGQQVCINGASGGVGSMAVQIARRLGGEVTAISSSGNHAFLRELGASHCIDYANTDIRQVAERFDVFFDVFGNHPFRSVRHLLKPGGTWVSTVLQPHVFASALGSRVLPGPRARLVVVKSNRADLDLLRGWVENGLVRPVVQEIYPLDRIADAHRQQESKHTRGKIVIRIVD